jgi:hypothetical protein
VTKLDGICIGGPFHGRRFIYYPGRWEAEDTSRWAYSSRLGIVYTYLTNEYGNWWVVE